MLIEVIPTLYTSTVGGDVVCSKVMPILEPSYREPRLVSVAKLLFWQKNLTGQ